jgi:zinc/manganese transport system substrate-binding protein
VHCGLRVVAALAAGLIGVAACSTSPTTGGPNGRIQVVAAESFWGSIARQLGGDRVDVTEIIHSAEVDPHDYEPTPADARHVAEAKYVIVNGLGYDAWASDLVAADGGDGNTVLDVGHLLGLHTGDNPHRWYFPDDVDRVIDRITSDYKSLDPQHASFYDEQRSQFVDNAMKPYHDAIAGIRAGHAGTPVGASESVVTGLLDAAGLDLRTPPSFLDAISEGNDPSAGDKVTIDEQIANRQISVFVYNAQNATPDVQQLVHEAQANHIPVVTVTETPSPADATFQDWQIAQLRQLASALDGGTP